MGGSDPYIQDVIITKKLHKNKILLSQFLRNYSTYKCKNLEKGEAYESYILSKKWCKYKTCNHIGITHEQSAIKKVLENFEFLPVEGIPIKLKKEKLIYFEKEDKDGKME